MCVVAKFFAAVDHPPVDDRRPCLSGNVGFKKVARDGTRLKIVLHSCSVVTNGCGREKEREGGGGGERGDNEKEEEERERERERERKRERERERERERIIVCSLSRNSCLYNNDVIISPQCMCPFIVSHDVILGCSLRAWLKVVLRALKTWLVSILPGLLRNKP